MSDSTTNLDELTVGQAQKEATANALFDAVSPATLFGRRASTSVALTWGYYGGNFLVDGEPTPIPNGTIALTASATNYLYTTDAGVITKVTSAPAAWPGPLASDAAALYEIVTNGSGVVSYTDYRTQKIGTPTGITVEVIGALIDGATAKTTPVNADMIGLMDSAASNVLKKVSWLNVKATLKTYFDTLYAPLPSPFDVHAFYPSTPTASAKICRIPVARAVTFPDDFAGSYGKASAVATASTAFDVQKNGSSVGTITFALGASTATFVTSGTTVVLAAGDVLSIIAPASPDATLADVGFVLAGTR